MAITQQIKPDPIVTSNIEVRFSSSLPYEKFGALVFDSFKDLLPTVQILENRVPNGSSFVPDLSFSNDQYSVAVGRNVILIEIINEYPGWESYFTFIKDAFARVTPSWEITSILRCGVRYASIFPRYEKMSDALISSSSFDFEGYSRVNDFIRTVFIKGQTQIMLQIGENFQVTQKGRGDKKGLYLDIDASQTENLPKTFNNSLFQIIDHLHDVEKSIFEQSLKKEELGKLLNKS